jgi:hypothetical protein
VLDSNWWRVKQSCRSLLLLASSSSMFHYVAFIDVPRSTHNVVSVLYETSAMTASTDQSLTHFARPPPPRHPPPPARPPSPSPSVHLRVQSGQFSEDMIPTVGFNMRKVTKGNVTIKVHGFCVRVCMCMFTWVWVWVWVWVCSCLCSCLEGQDPVQVQHCWCAHAADVISVCSSLCSCGILADNRDSGVCGSGESKQIGLFV